MPGGVEDEGSRLLGLMGMASRLFPRSVATAMDGAGVLGGTDLLGLRHVMKM
jgi:hypothetical protein